MSAEPPSLGMRALLLIRLGARQGQWVSVADLATMRQLPAPAVRAGLQSLADDGHVRLRLDADGLIDAAMCAVTR